ncbi:MAG: hypothetical protein DLM72_03375 [Candidatus Nitrosopolaris wilkensis]|nr:MAG: hypothetical protein DLM72_03375 [Candidatus Nitrosopolaris wilkensis]
MSCDGLKGTIIFFKTFIKSGANIGATIYLVTKNSSCDISKEWKSWSWSGWFTWKSDFLGSKADDDSCNPSNGDAYYAVYKVGYYTAWHMLHTLKK